MGKWIYSSDKEKKSYSTNLLNILREDDKQRSKREERRNWGVVGKGYKWVRKGKRIKNKKKEVWKVVREGEG